MTQGLDSRNADYAHGPRLADWLEPRLPKKSGRDGEKWLDNLRRQLHRMRDDGACVGFVTVDKYVTKLGLHVSEVPPEIWVEPVTTGKPGWRRLPDDGYEPRFPRHAAPLEERIACKLRTSGPLSITDLRDHFGLANCEHIGRTLREREGTTFEVVGVRRVKGQYPARLWGLVESEDRAA